MLNSMPTGRPGIHNNASIMVSQASNLEDVDVVKLKRVEGHLLGGFLGFWSEILKAVSLLTRDRELSTAVAIEARGLESGLRDLRNNSCVTDDYIATVCGESHSMSGVVSTCARGILGSNLQGTKVGWTR